MSAIFCRARAQCAHNQITQGAPKWISKKKKKKNNQITLELNSLLKPQKNLSCPPRYDLGNQLSRNLLSAGHAALGL
jgi:hypothetical protein